MFLLDYCSDLRPVIKIVKAVFNLIQFGIPIILILFGVMDLGKAVMASKEDEMKKAQSTLLKRVIYAVAIFFIVFIVRLAINLVGNAQSEEGSNAADTTSWSTCWDKY
jgi:large-conductance mechanosensitive channel